jgi:hypothetical protein
MARRSVLSVKTQSFGLTCEAMVGLVASLLEHPTTIWQLGEEVFGETSNKGNKIFSISRTLNSLSN